MVRLRDARPRKVAVSVRLDAHQCHPDESDGGGAAGALRQPVTVSDRVWSLLDIIAA
jgi:hypothetical protein